MVNNENQNGRVCDIRERAAKSSPGIARRNSTQTQGREARAETAAETGFRPRFRRKGLDRRRNYGLASHFGECQALPADLREGKSKAVRITEFIAIRILPIVEAEHLLIQSSGQGEMVRLLHKFHSKFS
jgi:hypothetical protein